MSANSERAVAVTPGALEPVAPSLVVKLVMRPMTKMLNPLIRTMAGRRHFRMAAQIRHVGRRSGRPYMTPAGARLSGDVAVIPLTFGNQSDWSRNVQAAGGCSIRLESRDYTAERPEFLSWPEAEPLIRSAFGPIERASFRMLGIRQFMRLHVVPAESLHVREQAGHGRHGQEPKMIDIARFAELVPGDHGLAVIALARPDGTVHASVANAGVLPHPVTGVPVAGVVAGGGSRKLGYLRTHPRATVVLRAGWRWAAVEGPAELAGPDDPLPGVDAERLRLLLREIFTAAGGTHDDFGAYDQAMAAQRRTAILVTPVHVYNR